LLSEAADFLLDPKTVLMMAMPALQASRGLLHFLHSCGLSGIQQYFLHLKVYRMKQLKNMSRHQFKCFSHDLVECGMPNSAVSVLSRAWSRCRLSILTSNEADDESMWRGGHPTNQASGSRLRIWNSKILIPMPLG
jgi:hypothetical protein